MHGAGVLKMGFFSSLWKQISVDLDDKTFRLKITEKKKLFILHGKLAISPKPTYTHGFSMNGEYLEFEPSLSNVSFVQVVDLFEKMLKENE
jgi:hypothetical protein